MKSVTTFILIGTKHFGLPKEICLEITRLAGWKEIQLIVNKDRTNVRMQFFDISCVMSEYIMLTDDLAFLPMNTFGYQYEWECALFTTCGAGWELHSSWPVEFKHRVVKEIAISIVEYDEYPTRIIYEK